MKKKITWLLAAAFTGIVVFSGVCQADGMSVDKEDGEYSIQVDLEGNFPDDPYGRRREGICPDSVEQFQL